MAPTLIGRHDVVTCPDCETQFRVPVELQKPIGDTFACWHCGSSIVQSSDASQPGDIIRIAPVDSTHGPLQRGDIVAIRRGGFLRAKRLIGMPGDTIDFRSGRLTVNGDAVRSTTKIPVDQDTLRKTSRWTGPATLHRDSDRSWRLVDASMPNRRPSWLIYGHRSVYAGGLPAPVRDDYPGNVNLRRELKPAHDLVLTLNVGPDSPNEQTLTAGNQPQSGMNRGIDVLFWMPDGVRMQTKTIPDEFTTLEFSSVASQPLKKVAPTDSVPTIELVSETSPVAIRIGEHVICSGLLLERLVTYRLNPDHDRSVYPTKLGNDQAFVVGDNVPVSIDSRDWGPVAFNDIVGRVADGP